MKLLPFRVRPFLIGFFTRSLFFFPEVSEGAFVSFLVFLSDGFQYHLCPTCEPRVVFGAFPCSLASKFLSVLIRQKKGDLVSIPFSGSAILTPSSLLRRCAAPDFFFPPSYSCFRFTDFPLLYTPDIKSPPVCFSARAADSFLVTLIDQPKGVDFCLPPTTSSLLLIYILFSAFRDPSQPARMQF